MNAFDFDHARRVAARVVTSDERLVALLHDAVEDGNATPEQMREMLGETDLLEAVRLLTRMPGVSYIDYIRQIYQADGYAGHLARAVKVADLTENLFRMDAEHERNRGRYEAALDLLNGRPSVLVRSS
jgi:(p)ppGpp synthase/HD superfamily hydrolase